MTIIFSEPTFGDKLLAVMGKKRAVFIPDIYSRFGKYAYGRAAKESFLPGWPLENPPPVAGSKSPTLRLAERGFI